MPSIPSWPSSVLSSTIDFLGLTDARFAPSDLSFVYNPFWTTFLLTLVAFPCLFYLTWYLNPALSRNRLGLSWVLGFYSATLFTIAGFYEVPHLRTIFNAAIDYHPDTLSSIVTPSLSFAHDLTTTAAVDTLQQQICYPILKASALTLLSAAPAFLRLDFGSSANYYCFSDLELQSSTKTALGLTEKIAAALFVAAADTGEKSHAEDEGEYDEESERGGGEGLFAPVESLYYNPEDTSTSSTTAQSVPPQDRPLSLRHRVFQGQMQRPHLLFSLENYPDDGRIGPHIIAANFQAFLIVDLILGAIHYRKQLEPFSTVVHHIIYYFIVVHMRAGDMLSVFCILGTPIEASSIFLAFGRMFPHRRTPTVERLYLFCFMSTRLLYVAFLWHEVFYNYPDKSVAFLYTITISLHMYWFVLYIQTQKRFQAKQRRQQLHDVLQSLASTVQKEYCVSPVVQLRHHNHRMVHEGLKSTTTTTTTTTVKTVQGDKTERTESVEVMREHAQSRYGLTMDDSEKKKKEDRMNDNENRASIEIEEKRDEFRPLLAQDSDTRECNVAQSV
ncbi:hypothetical protein BG011_005572 [Mortierella polycephala]|uniref:TLC domain-containing protein n=1 Tax=Mortierella polycephala TaxID=41804 RepID=A0A9P6U0Q7_9FUNG|nr:hypothetical protein BG011_005572 [Mortierella polycephala]